MKLAQLTVAAAIIIPAASSFAQSTPPALNEDVRAQLVQEKMIHRSTDSNDQKLASLNEVGRNGSPTYHIAEMSLGHYSMTVEAPSH
jgi:hypothetical protein